MNEQELGSQIAHHLDRGADQLKPGTLYRLQAARRKALDKFSAAPVSSTWAITNSLGPVLSAKSLLMLAVLLAGLGGAVYWQNLQQSNDLVEIDLSLLTDDLPINAYLDKDFDAWLNRS
ncbi:MAG: DUF3619 family protein [Burkholderiales bacterium]